jgi:cytochrome c biogenesis protein CcmG, thiol:disulfide interchange protein DsbE
MNRTILFGFPLVLFLGLGAVFLSQLRSGKQASEIESVLVGQEVPPVVLPAVAGRAGAGFDAAGLKTGQPSVVNFWATWCAPCKIEHPHLLALKARGVTVHGVLYRDKAAAATDYLQEMGDPFTMLGDDAKGLTGIEFGITGVPETFVVDGHGKVVLRFQGPLDEDSVKRQILPALNIAP